MTKKHSRRHLRAEAREAKAYQDARTMPPAQQEKGSFVQVEADRTRKQPPEKYST